MLAASGSLCSFSALPWLAVPARSWLALGCVWSVSFCGTLSGDDPKKNDLLGFPSYFCGTGTTAANRTKQSRSLTKVTMSRHGQWALIGSWRAVSAQTMSVSRWSRKRTAPGSSVVPATWRRLPCCFVSRVTLLESYWVSTDGKANVHVSFIFIAQFLAVTTVQTLSVRCNLDFQKVIRSLRHKRHCSIPTRILCRPYVASTASSRSVAADRAVHRQLR